ncbi:hypothetical protein Klosneuvirus_6_95 [Klosneuvirus KNV1]|uniref:Uncharacterized protein n=1 Tax=Klosneuvirus KNV1 TaxID=1977640 RepID=A0A1V0SLE4_9VIRU|nr:hypothetical protein Klosneuvirus_6_95 [Klosneuvirus KNV1]
MELCNKKDELFDVIIEIIKKTSIKQNKSIQH